MRIKSSDPEPVTPLKPEYEYEHEAVLKTLDWTYCPDAIREARTKQDQILVERFHGELYTIADIGCGNGYHGALFAPSCRLYHGFEIVDKVANIARTAWNARRLSNTEVFVGDAGQAEPPPDFYDLVFCLYFTVGNFREQLEDLGLYTDPYLDQNPKFISVISRFYMALKASGSMLLTIYKDLPEAEESQIELYRNTGQHVITPRGSRFVATAEGFWSVRWTEQSMLSNLRACGIEGRDVLFHNLNRIAWLVEIRK
ncbi:MAG TPA: class I SAM-dependent methyltransferase [Blastocatellia bacterium]|nr:class I SAM-dependent methyltransferase [Blastocatellia bacterium]